MGELSRSLSRLVSKDWSTRVATASQQAMQGIVRTAFIDTAACILAGRAEPVSGVVLGWAEKRYAGDNNSSIAFGSLKLPTAAAALVNASTGHALDFDDVALAGHPSVVLVPAIWAEHERTGQSGFDLVQAYAKGYAVWADLARRPEEHLHALGWHPTAIFGAVAAAAAIASLRRFSDAQCNNAMGIAASMAGGVIANFGSMTKSLHAGRAAEAGITAAELTEAGLTASADALDGPAGLLNALTGGRGIDLASPCAPDAELSLVNTRPGIKKYPVCYAAHRVIDGVLDLAARHGFGADEVAKVDATISETTAKVLRHHAPENIGAARFSLEFCVASALVHQKLGVAQVSEAELRSPAVMALMRLVHTHTVDTRCPLEPSFAFTDRVRLTLRNGAVLDSGEIRFARGHTQLPLTEAAQLQKFNECLSRGEEAFGASVLARIDQALDIA